MAKKGYTSNSVLILIWFFIILFLSFIVPQVYSLSILLFIAALLLYFHESKKVGTLIPFYPAMLVSIGFIVFSLQAMLLAAGHELPGLYYPKPMPIELIEKGVIYTIVGLISFSIGYLSSIGFFVGKRLPTLPSNWVPLWTWARGTIIYSLILVSFVAYVVLMKLAGVTSFSQLINTSYTAATTHGPVASYFRFLFLNGFYSVLVLWYINLLRKNRTYSFSFMLYVCLVLFLFWTLGSVGIVIFPLLSLFFCYYFLYVRVYNRKIPFFKLLLGGLFLMFFIFTAKLYRRYMGAIGEFSLAIIIDLFKTDFTVAFWEFFKLTIMRLGAFPSFLTILHNFPCADLSYLYGVPYILFPLRFIPFLPIKDPEFSGWFYTSKIYPGPIPPHHATSPTLLGELYINFGIVGIIFGMMLFGFIAKTIFAYLMVNQKNYGVILLYSQIFWSFWALMDAGFNSGVTLSVVITTIFTFVLLNLIKGAAHRSV